MSAMSAMSRLDVLPPGPWTADDLDRFPTGTGRRYELLDGALLVSAEPSLQHQRVAGRLGRLLEAACPPRLEVFALPVDVRLAERRQVAPDLVVVRREHAQGARLTGLPLLAVEVLSPSTRTVDLVLKRQALQDAGVPSYWLVDPVEPSVVVLELRDRVYAETARAGPGGAFVVRLPFAVRIAVDDLG